MFHAAVKPFTSRFCEILFPGHDQMMNPGAGRAPFQARLNTLSCPLHPSYKGRKLVKVLRVIQQTTQEGQGCRAIRTARKSPSEITGKPALIISTPSVSSCMATCIFCSTFIAAPGHCSPSLSVVSKICICSFIYSKNVKRSFLRELRTENVPVTESFLWCKSRQPFTSLAPERLTGAYQDIFTDLPSEKQQ